MKPLFPIVIFFILLQAPTTSSAQDIHPPAASKLIVVIPFENISSAPGIDWIGESFPEIVGSRLVSPGIYVINRADRLYAFDRMGIPAISHPSRATLFQIADQMDVDYMVTGKYSFDGRTFTARAQLIDMRRLRLSPEVVESGALTQLLGIQNALAWDLAHTLDPSTPGTKEAFVDSASPVRLDALENYIRGVISVDSKDKLRFLKQAVRLNPDYAEAQFLLGKTYFDAKEYSNASVAFSKVPKTNAIANEANFYLGLASYYIGNFEKAEEAFSFTAKRLPLLEVYNNLGVVSARRGKKAALDYFSRAVTGDPGDADYRFNYGLALYRNGNTSNALKQLKESLNLRPQDAEAKSTYEMVNAGIPLTSGDASSASSTRPPLERIKRNYDETSYRQLALEIKNAREIRFATLPRPQHAAAHVERGSDLFEQSLNDEAENEFREAILLDPTSYSGHLGLARIFFSRGELAAAKLETQTALRLGGEAKGVAEVFLLLGSIEVKLNKVDSAQEYYDHATHLDPAHPGLAALQRAIAERRAEKPQSELRP